MAESAPVEVVTGIRAKIKNPILTLNGEPRIMVVAEPLMHAIVCGRAILSPGRCPTCQVFSPDLFGNSVNNQYRGVPGVGPAIVSSISLATVVQHATRTGRVGRESGDDGMTSSLPRR